MSCCTVICTSVDARLVDLHAFDESIVVLESEIIALIWAPTIGTKTLESRSISRSCGYDFLLASNS